MMKERKTNYNWFWDGIKHDISLCCIMFFETAWANTIRNQIDEYSETMTELTNNEGVILCPDCIVTTIVKKLN